MISDGYAAGDDVLWMLENGKKTLLLGKPIEDRKAGEIVPLIGLRGVEWTPSGENLLLITAIHDDTYSLGFLALDKPGEVLPVHLEGRKHTGVGEMTKLKHLKGTHYLVEFNIDGCSWAYEAVYNETKREMTLRYVLVGEGDLANGKIETLDYDKKGDRFSLSFSTAVSPTQIYTVEGKDRETIVMHTEERILGIPESHLSKGEDASFIIA